MSSSRPGEGSRHLTLVPGSIIGLGLERVHALLDYR